MRSYAYSAETKIFLGTCVVFVVHKVFHICNYTPAVTLDPCTQIEHVKSRHDKREGIPWPGNSNTPAFSRAVKRGIQTQRHGRGIIQRCQLCCHRFNVRRRLAAIAPFQAYKRLCILRDVEIILADRIECFRRLSGSLLWIWLAPMYPWPGSAARSQPNSMGGRSGS